MESENGSVRVYPRSEVFRAVRQAPAGSDDSLSVVETLGRRIRVEWDGAAPVTSIGQVVYFAQLLATAGRFTG